jgi:hypothetical protein
MDGDFIRGRLPDPATEVCVVDVPNVVERICSLPVDFKQGLGSASRLVQGSGYLELPSGVPREAVRAFLENNPHLQDDWLYWSQDKRSLGWYLTRRRADYVVVFYPEKGEKLQKVFQSKLDASVEFVLEEIASIAENIRER